MEATNRPEEEDCPAKDDPPSTDSAPTSKNADLATGRGEHDGIGFRESGHGLFYHMKLCTLILLRATQLYQKGRSFSMTAEHKSLNPFDDIVLILGTGHERFYFLIQAKHGQSSKGIVAKDILKDKHNNWGEQFTVLKYFKGFCKIKTIPELEDVRKNLVVCTNITLDLEDLKKQCLPVKPYENTLFTELLPESKGKCYRFLSKGKCVIGKELKKTQVSDGDVRQFQEDFVIAAGLPDEQSLGKIIEKEIGAVTESISSEIMASKFIEKLQDLIKQRKGTWISGKDSQMMMDEISHMINSLGSKVLDLYDKLASFVTRVQDKHLIDIAEKIDIFLNSQNTFLHILSINTRSFLTFLKIYQVLEKTERHKITYKILRYEIIFTEFNSFVSEDPKKYIESALRTEKKLLVVYSEKKDNLQDVQKLFFEIFNICVEKKKKIIFITEDDLGINDTGFKQSRTEDFGFNFTHLEDESKRNMIQRCIVTFQGVKGYNLMSLFGEYEKLVVDLDEIMEGDTLVLFIKEEEVRIGKKVKETAVISHLYVERKLICEDTEVTEDEVLEADKRALVIIDEPGSGKSTLFNSFLRKLGRREGKDVWKCRINLNNYTKILQKESKSRKKLTDRFDNGRGVVFFVDDMLQSFMDTEFESPFEKELFKKALLGDTKVLLFFDGFDEICPNYQELVMSLFHSLVRGRSVNLYVSTRPISGKEKKNAYEGTAKTRVYEQTKKIINLPNATYCSIAPLTKDERVYMLAKYWTESYGFSDDEEAFGKFRDISEQSSSYVKSSLLENPLALVMTAEHWKEPAIEIFNRTNSSVRSQIDITNHLQDRLGYFDLYRYFIDKKLEIYRIDKSCQDSGNISSDNKHSFFVNALLRVLYHLALKTVFEEETAEEMMGTKLWLDPYIKTELPKVGLLFESGDLYEFVHRTFAEHLALEFIRSNPESSSPLQTEHWESFMRNIPYTRWDETFKLIIDGWFDVYKINGDECLVDRLRYLCTYAALVRRYRHRRTKLLMKEDPEVDEETKDELLSIGLLVENCPNSRKWKGLRFVYWRMAEHFVKDYIDSHRHDALTLDEKISKNAEKYFRW